MSRHGLVPDGVTDGVFEATVEGPIIALSLVTTNAAGTPVGGQIWNTIGGDAIWDLGVEEDGALLNRPDRSIPTLAAGVHRLRLYANIYAVPATR